MSAGQTPDLRPLVWQPNVPRGLSGSAPLQGRPPVARREMFKWYPRLSVAADALANFPRVFSVQHHRQPAAILVGQAAFRSEQMENTHHQLPGTLGELLAMLLD